MKAKWLFAATSLALFTAGCQPTTQQEASEVASSNGHSVEKTDRTQNQQAEEKKLSLEEQKRKELIAQLPEDASPNDWNLILVNNETPLEEELDLSLAEVEPGKWMDERIVEPYEEWMAAASEAGHSIYFASGYRSVERQTNNYQRKINGYIAEGYSEEEATQKTEDYIAIPGSSEHHTGLALDLVDNEWIASGNGLEPEYDTQASQHWLVDTMADYGFILRYPEGTEDITGIEYESWHFRYVGPENARFMVENDLVLEEYVDLLNEREEAAHIDSSEQ